MIFACPKQNFFLFFLLSSYGTFAVAQKFQNWFGYYGEVLENEIKGTASSGYNDCSLNYTLYNKYRIVNPSTYCYQVYDCLLGGLLPNEQSNFASAQVFLGLTPTLLVLLAPSVAETSLLSSNRPVLALLLAAGIPSVSVQRLLVYEDPTLILLRSALSPTWLRSFLRGPKGSIASGLQYLLALLAAGNVIEVSWRLGVQTVIAWKCESSYLPILWTFLSLATHILAAGGWRFSTTMRRLQDQNQKPLSLSWIQTEFCLCINGKKRGFLDQEQMAKEKDSPRAQIRSQPSDGWATYICVQGAGIFQFLLLLFGTIVFSSMMFIATIDAFEVVVRYIVSGIVCRFILIFELNGMQIVENEDSEHVELVSLVSSSVAK